MHSRKPSRLRRSAPFALAMVMSAIFAGPAFGQAAVNVTYNTSDILIAELNAKTVTVERGATTLATGTPAGVGFARTPPLLIEPDDLVEVEIENLGLLANPVVEYAPVRR